jgi:aminomuconate-semialdehyde/2-hydroxymuconate-6-semialdehyde dehydrogenase
MPHSIHNYINGQFVPPASRDMLDVIEPATGRVHARVAHSDAADVAHAVDAAARAFPAWRGLTTADRSRILLRLADLIDNNLERLAHAESLDAGKPISLTRSLDIPRSAANFRFFATAILHATSEASVTDQPAAGAPLHALNYTLRKPRGVAGLISPWNLPLYLLTWKIAPALATGNTCVAKPSELTPLTASILCELATQAGIPPGVLNIVHGTGEHCGKPIVQHGGVPTISFTGSTPVGRWIASHCGESLKRVSLELGGKNPMLVFEDADPITAATEALRAAFTNSGQICLCASRILVHQSIYTKFREALVAAACQLVPGDPLEPATRHGALVSRQHLEKVHGFVQLARDLGGTIHCGGTPAMNVSPRCEGGYFYPPTVIDGLDPHCRVEKEEIFGPVITLQPFRTDEEAIALANATDYGLAASVWTANLTRAHRIASLLDAGIVWINCWMVRDLRTPFGGVKNSGVGREGGLEALRFFTEPTSVTLRV